MLYIGDDTERHVIAHVLQAAFGVADTQLVSSYVVVAGLTLPLVCVHGIEQKHARKLGVLILLNFPN